MTTLVLPFGGARRHFFKRTTALAAISLLSSASTWAGSKLVGGGSQRMPVIFIGHGSPMNALEQNDFTKRLARWGQELPRPAAILSVSAHWLSTGVTGVNIQANPETIHDFGGFPPALHAMQYPAPGHPTLAHEVATLVRQTSVQETERWGLDHGTWTVLKHMYPKADVPVFQLSIDYSRPADFHYAIGQELRELRKKGVLVMGSGNVVHNLRATERVPANAKASQPWAQQFDDAVATALSDRDDLALLKYQGLPGAGIAVATPDHYYPFLYALGAADATEKTQTIYEGFQGGTLSMRCVQWG